MFGIQAGAGKKPTRPRVEKRHGSGNRLGSSSSGHRCTTDTLYFLFTRRLRLLCTTLQSKLSKLSLHNPFFNRICHESGDCSVVKKKTKKKKIVVQNSTPICPKQLNPTAECLVTTKIKTRLFFSEKCEVASTEPVCGVQKCAFGSSIAFVIYDARTALREIEFERLPPLSLFMAASSSSANNTANIITALGNAFKDPSGAALPNERLAAVLLQNMNQLNDLAKQGKLNQQQIMQVRS